MPEVDVLAVLASTVVAFLLGAAYYAVLGSKLAEVSAAAAADRGLHGARPRRLVHHGGS